MKTIVLTIAFVLTLPLAGWSQTPAAASSIQAPASQTSATTTTADAAPPPAPTASPEDAFIRKLSLRQKIGQMFMIGFQGTSLSDQGLGETIKAIAPGGLVVFSRNITSPKQVSRLLLDAQRASLGVSRIPLFTGVDQEGGNVIRIKTAMPLPSALAFGKANNQTLTESAGFATGQLLKTLGFNMNLAPVLDVAGPEQPEFIGTRTYGDDPELVGRMGVAFSKGLVKAGVFPVGKHFPGHGGVTEDSHEDTPTKHMTADELKGNELIPFARMQENFENRWGVMLAHISYPKIDPTGAPATLSKPIVDSLLRDGLKFDGIVLTDDIEMGGAFKVKNVNERVLRAIEAGSDMIMVAWNKKLQRQLIGAVERAVRTKRIPEERINASVKRILVAKRAFASTSLVPPSDKQLLAVTQNPKFGEAGEEAMRARFSGVAEPEEREFKEYASDKPILVFSANDKFSESFKSALKGKKVRVFSIDVDRPFDVDKIMLSNPQAVGVFYVSGYQAGKVASKISEEVARRMLLVTVEVQSILKNASHFRYVADVYYRHPQLGKIVAKHFFSQEDELRQPAGNPKPKTVSVSRPRVVSDELRPARSREPSRESRKLLWSRDQVPARMRIPAATRDRSSLSR